MLGRTAAQQLEPGGQAGPGWGWAPAQFCFGWCFPGQEEWLPPRHLFNMDIHLCCAETPRGSSLEKWAAVQEKVYFPVTWLKILLSLLAFSQLRIPSPDPHGEK